MLKIQKPTKEQLQKSSVILEIVFLASLFLFYFLWAWTQPYNTAPDEAMRYDIPTFIYEHGRLPHGGDPSIRNPIWGISYGFNPILSYIFAAGFMKITSIFTTQEFALLMAARMVSVLFGVGTAFFTIRISKKLFPFVYRPLFICLVCLLPQMAYIASYVNNDSMAICTTAMIVYMWILGIESNWDKKSCVGLALSISLCALSYYNAYGFILCSILLFCFTTAFCQNKKYDFGTMWKKGWPIAAIVLVCIGWWFIRNALIYDGDFMARAIAREYGEMYAAPGFKPSDHFTYQKAGMPLLEMLLTQHWLRDTKFSFIACFGNMEHYLNLSTYDIYLYPLYFGAFGMLFQLPNKFRLRKDKKWHIDGIFHLLMAVAMVIPVFLSIYYSYTSDFQAQGRYILPMIIPLMYFAVLGLKTITEFLIRKERIWIFTFGYSLIIVLTTVQAFTQIFYPAYH